VSEFLAEARVLIRPDTTAFRAALVAELAAVTKGVTVPVPVIPVVAAGAAGAQVSAQTAVTQGLVAQAAAAKQAAGAQEELGRRTGQTTKQLLGAGTASQSLNAGLLGLRAAAGTTAVIGLGAVSLAAIAAGNALRTAVASASGLERQLNIFQATVGASALEMEQASAAAEQLGSDIRLPGVSAQDAASSINLLARAGLSVQDSIEGSRGTLALAAAAMTDVGTASTITASALNSFGLAGADASRVADLLTGASIEAQGEITDMALALQQASAVANLAGLSLEDTVTFITQLAQAGLRGSDAGTSLRVALIRLIAPTSAAAGQLKELGVRIRDAQGNVRPEIFTDLQAALQGLDEAASQRVLFKIFGTDALRAAAILGREGPKAFDATQEAITKLGLAEEVAAGQTKGLSGDFERLKNEAGETALVVGQLASPVLSGLAQMATTTFGAINKLAGVVGLGAVAPVAETAGERLSRLTVELGSARQELEAFRESAGGFVSPVEADAIAALEQKIADLEKATRDATDATLGFGPPLVGVTQELIDLTLAAGKAATALGGPLTAAMIAGQTQAQQTAIAQSRAFGENALQELIDLRDRIDVILEGPRRPTGPALEALLNQRASTLAQIEAIFQQNAQDKQEAADRIARAQDAADQAFVDKVERGATRRANRLLIAEGTKTLADDIATQRSIRQFYRDRIAEVRRTVDDAKLAARLIGQFTKEVVTAEQAIAQAQLEQRQRRQDARQERERLAREAAETRSASIDLDIELAETTENETAEVAARNRKIRELQRQLAAEAEAHGKNTLLYKQIRNEIASEKAALDDLRSEQDAATDSARSFRQATFEFLQAQQGFAANLLGNLIPSSATAGLVGNAGLAAPVGASAPPPGTGVVPIDFGLGAQAAVTEAKQTGGPTSGQAQTTNGLLGMIYRELVALNDGEKTPEATRQRKRSNAVMDGVGGG
jgi:TP901 family phage tail tape measure protein